MNKLHVRKNAIGLGGAVSLLALMASPAFAQNATADEGGIQDIVVTAQKRAENLQEVPISIAAVSGATVEDLHAATLQGLQNTVPNVQIGTFMNTPNTAVFNIRGIGVIEPDPYAGNTVGIVVDGIPQFFSMGALLDLYDVDRIEILRGPQGTLFGANTTGGVVSVVTGQPTDTFGGKFNLNVGNYSHANAAAMINAPLGEGLAARFSVSHDQRKGFVTNVINGDDLGKRNVTLFRGALKYTAGDFDATWQNEYVVARNGSPVVVAGDTPADAEYVPAGWRNMYASPCMPAGQPCHAPNKYYSASEGVPDISDMDTYSSTLTMNLRNTGFGDITSITGYKKIKLKEYTDQDGTPAFLIDTRRGTKLWQFSQELRTDLEVNDSIDLLLGGFYMKTHYDHYQDLRIDFAGGATYFDDGTYTKGFTGLFQKNIQDQDNWSGSVFAQSYIRLTEKLRIQAGIRYSHEKTDMDASTATSLALGGVTTWDGTAPDGTPNFAMGGAFPGKKSASWNNVGWKLGLDYKFTDDIMAYGYWARGFKSGGFTGRIGIAQDVGPYNPEHVDTFEIGLKADMLDRHLRTNFAAFYTNYRDMQLAQIYFVGSGADLVQGNTILNAAGSHIKGFEAEVTAVPLEGLTISGSLSYLDAKYSKFDYLLPNGDILDLKGKRLQNAPKWSGSANLSYKFPLTGDVSGRFNIQYSYTGEKLLTSIIDTARSTIQPMNLVNANFDVTINENMQLGVYATNLFDKRYINSVFDAPGTLGLTNYQAPRQYGVSASYKF